MANSAVRLEHYVFLDEFLFNASGALLPVTIESRNTFAALQRADDLSNIDLSTLFADAVNSNKLGPGFRVCSFAPDQQTEGGTRACIAMFRDGEGDEVSWFDQIVPFEFRQQLPGIDPFEDIPSSTASIQVKRARAQTFAEISSRAELLFASRQCVFLFMFLVIGRRFFCGWIALAFSSPHLLTTSTTLRSFATTSTAFPTSKTTRSVSTPRPLVSSPRTLISCAWTERLFHDAWEAASRATRAHHMGAYQFMSLNLLSDLSRPVQIPDALESFFHVLVYYAVRYLNSNCKSSTGFVQCYFDTYAGPGNAYACGQKSVAMKSSGVLYMQHPYKPLLFHTPMENLLATMLKSFRAYYKVLEHEAWKVAPPPPTPPRHKSPSPSEGFDEETIPFAPMSPDEPPPDVSDDTNWNNQDDTLVTSIPTAEDLKLAARVTHHKFLLKYMA